MKTRILNVAVALAVTCSAAWSDDRPNVLFILTDDQGWTTPSCYGNLLVDTPHLDGLADQGVRFTDAYVMPQCTPTRAALLTGQHTARNGMWHVIPWYGLPWASVFEPPFVEQLKPEQCRLPHQMRAAGYATGMAGKWHLTSNDRQGYYTHLNAAAADEFGFDWVAPPGKGSQNEGDKWVDHLTDQTCEFIEQNRNRPWFCYLSHHTLHGIVSAPDGLVKAYRDRRAPAEGLHNATYLAAIKHLDNSIGRLLAKLEELSLDGKTMVVFLSDNGGVKNRYKLPTDSKATLRGDAPLQVEMQEFDNAPLREGKGSVYEGGIRVPCIVRLPGVVEPGVVESIPIHVVDWFPTLMSLAGNSADEPEDGANLMPLLRGEALPDRPLFWHMPLYDLRWASVPASAIRQGDWKLIEFYGDRFDLEGTYQSGHKLELYNLNSDIGESNDVSDQYPERTQQMQASLRSWIKHTGAKPPAPNQHFDPARAFDETREKQSWNQ